MAPANKERQNSIRNKKVTPWRLNPYILQSLDVFLHTVPTHNPIVFVPFEVCPKPISGEW